MTYFRTCPSPTADWRGNYLEARTFIFGVMAALVHFTCEPSSLLSYYSIRRLRGSTVRAFPPRSQPSELQSNLIRRQDALCNLAH